MRDADFERLYDEHAQRLFGFLVYRTGDRELAQDLLADTFEAAFRTRRRFDRRRASERTWLYAIALNRLIDHDRRARVEARALVQIAPSGIELQEDQALASVASRDELRRAMIVLAVEEREALALRFGGGLTLREIARALGVPESTAEARVYRALRKLRAELLAQSSDDQPSASG